MITTNTHRGGNFLVHATDILGPWSDPVWIDHDGIDPSLFWDEDGRAYYIGTGRTQLLSTEAMPCTFTGCLAGLFAEGETEAVFPYFSAAAPEG